ncbi:hypothetical protein NUU61_000253 [Penicillium alfredii]|uniref:Uncharacterized protein n=1 Tax=Penicillium alfredii TaxID=1506179 RepID=A0A9W9KPK4_9EURO|nr:uncharacterized protein NUU61_000253 [Penicillium alfredii]KAJ5114494.1 hypothetical protein NUU61_000253 [Penicillium alfredii]
MQVPTVTLEDLHAFHTKHFPGQPQTLVPPSASDNTAVEEGTDEEDLGSYPDGVKRTLTDEQIRIFRHSEIHALLRARQLQEDDAEYEARRRLSDSASGAEMNPVDEASQAKELAGVGDDGVQAQRQPHPESEAPAGSHESLDYGEDERDAAPVHKKPRAEAQPPFSRRVVSYDD